MKILPEGYRFAIEFRHKTWWDEAAWRLLRKYDVANTIIDEPILLLETVVTAAFCINSSRLRKGLVGAGRFELPTFGY